MLSFAQDSGNPPRSMRVRSVRLIWMDLQPRPRGAARHGARSPGVLEPLQARRCSGLPVLRAGVRSGLGACSGPLPPPENRIPRYLGCVVPAFPAPEGLSKDEGRIGEVLMGSLFSSGPRNNLMRYENLYCAPPEGAAAPAQALPAYELCRASGCVYGNWSGAKFIWGIYSRHVCLSSFSLFSSQQYSLHCYPFYHESYFRTVIMHSSYRQVHSTTKSPTARNLRIRHI